MDPEQLESRIDARFQAFTQEVDQFREELAHSAQAAEEQTKHLKEWTREKLNRETHVESFVRELVSQSTCMICLLFRCGGCQMIFAFISWCPSQQLKTQRRLKH